MTEDELRAFAARFHETRVAYEALLDERREIIFQARNLMPASQMAGLLGVGADMVRKTIYRELRARGMGTKF